MHGNAAHVGLLLAGAVLLGACNFPGLAPTPDAFATAAAQTVAAQLTEAAGVIPTDPPPTQTPAPATATPEPTEVPPSPTPESTVCTDRSTFVSDVTIPDDTNVSAGENLTKIWRVRNTGTCTWNTNYSLVFDSGNSMNGPTSVPLPGRVPPNSTVDLTVELVAPQTDGIHRGDWRFRNDSGVLFGLVYIQVVVGATPTPRPTLVYSLVDNYCDADWASGAGALACPGSDSDTDGFVIRLNNPRLENGIVENERGLWTQPELVNDGFIRGTFPSIEVEDGNRFRTVLACKFDGPACNVRFKLQYRENGGPLMTLGEWTETHDGSIRKLDIDLSSLAGESVEFVLTVEANGPATEDWAIWLLPRIVRR